MMITLWGAPGAGKTALTVQLAYALSREGCLVGVIAANTEFSELPALLRQSIFPKHGLFMAIKDKNVRAHFWKSPVHENLFMLTVPTAYSGFDGETISQEEAETVLGQSSEHFDVVLVDGHESMFNPISSVALTKARSILTLHRPSPKAAAWYASRETSISLLRLEKKLMHIENRPEVNIDPSVYWRGIRCKPTLTMPYIPDAGLPFSTSAGRSGKEMKAFLSELSGQLELGKESAHE